MFSRRTHWNHDENALTLLRRQKERQGIRLIDLTASNPTQCGLPSPGHLRSAVSALGQVYQPDPRGSRTAREAIAAFYAAQNIQVHPDHIFITSGSSESYSHLFRLLCDAGDSVLSPIPSYPLFDHLAQLADVSLVPYVLRFDGEWHWDLAAMENNVHTARAAVVIHPHNPTGMMVKQADRAGLTGFLQARTCALIADEVFSAFRFSPEEQTVSSFADTDSVLTFTLNGLSKLAGLPQLKVGWIVVSGPPEQQTEACRRLEIINDAFLAVSTASQLALPSIMKDLPLYIAPIDDRLRVNLTRLHQAVDRCPLVTLLSPDGGWNAVLRLPLLGSEDEDWSLLFLKKADVVTYPGHFFDFAGGEYVVLSLLPSPEAFEEGVERLLSTIAQTAHKAGSSA